jgi:hypothetical protein
MGRLKGDFMPFDFDTACTAAGVTTQDDANKLVVAAKMVADSGITLDDVQLAMLQIQRNALTTAMANIDSQQVTAIQGFGSQKQALQSQANALDAQISAKVQAQLAAQQQ